MKTTQFLKNEWKWTFSSLEDRQIYKQSLDKKIIKVSPDVIEEIKNITIEILSIRTEKLLTLIDIDLKENPVAFNILDLDESQAKKKFSRTEFSNIYPVEVYYEWKTWPSNEHAYMYKKFNFEEVRNYFKKNINEFEAIKEDLRERFSKLKSFNNIEFNKIFTIKNLESLYSDDRINWYFIKVLSKKIEELNLRIPEWEDIKLEILVWLNIEKYDQKHFRDKLNETKWMKMVEWNDWGDVFWWVDTNMKEWLNYLWRTLELIRDNEI